MPEEKSVFKTIIDKLNAYKEVLAILVFFSGGVSWIYGFFATKDQVNEYRCITNANIEFLSGQMNYNALSSMLLENVKEQYTIKQKATRTPLEENRLIQLGLASKELEKQIDSANKEKNSAIKKLKSGHCSNSQ